MADNTLAVFENHKIRRHYDKQMETWYFSMIDVVAALTDSVNPMDYWFKMKIRVKTEDGLELSTICRQLKMKAADGKMRATYWNWNQKQAKAPSQPKTIFRRQKNKDR